MSPCMLSHFSHVRLFVIQWTVARQAPLSIGLSWQEFGSGLPCPPPVDLPHSGMKLHLLHILHCRQILYLWTHWGSPPPPVLVPWLLAKFPVLYNDNNNDISNLFSACDILSTLLDLCWHYCCSSLKPGFKMEAPLSRWFTCVPGKFAWLLDKDLCSSLLCLSMELLEWPYNMAAGYPQGVTQEVKTGAAVFVMPSIESHALLLP